jgi:uncharacterized protein (TIGR03067 family)
MSATNPLSQPPSATGPGTPDAVTLAPLPAPEGPAGTRAAIPGEETTTRAVPGAPRVAGYDILGELGRGGMGVVYQARQRGLDRLVALKMILAGAQAGAEELVRFQAEAAAVARLRHPNIVQVYEVGEAEGRPFFSLEYVEGGSLAARLGGTPQPAGDAAELVETLARAVHYAHQQGVVHRDLKPANILMVSGGVVRGEGSPDTTHHSPLTTHQPKITDFGLAKRLDSDAGQTRSGAIVGTPSYMAPEQADGKGTPVGPAADVYALGAILYELLTGRPPFKAATGLDTVLQVVTEDPVPPRRLQPKVPRDLETICLKCLQKAPGKRYPDAQALADDLRRFLDGEPVQARPTPAWERAVKWARRRPAAAALVALSVLAALALFGLGWWYNRDLQEERDYALAQRDAATRAKEEAERQQRRARAILRQALQGVDRLTQVTPERFPLLSLQMTEERRLRLKDALVLCRGYLREEKADPAGRREVGQTYARLASLHLLLGQFPEAETAARQALDCQEKLVADFPGRRDLRYDLARSRITLGHFCSITRRAEAAEAYHKALALLEPLTRTRPHVARYQQALAECHLNLAVLHLLKGQFKEAEPGIAVHVKISRRLVQEHPGVAGYQGLLAAGYSNLGLVYNNTGRPAKAIHVLRKSLALFTKLTRNHPRAVKDFELVGASSRLNLGAAYVLTRRPTEAGPLLQKGFDRCEQMGRAYPQVPTYAHLCIQGYGLLIQNTLQGKPAAVLGLANRAVTLLETMAGKQPSNPQVKFYLSLLYASRAGDALGPLGRHAEALADWDRAIALEKGPARQANLRLNRALTLAYFGKHRRAVQEAGAVIGKGKPSVPAQYTWACVYGVAARAARKDSRLAPKERVRQAEQYAARAVALLTEIQGGGPGPNPIKADKLKSDPDLNPLRLRADFRKLLAVWEELDHLRGGWTVVSAEVAGRPEPAAKGILVTVAGTRFAVTRPGQVLLNGEIRLDPAARPRAIDGLYTTRPNKGQTRLGIYRLDGDTLTACFCDLGKKRPTTFSTTEGTGFMLFVCRRAKP